MRQLIPYSRFLTIMVVVKNFKDARFTIVQGQTGDSSKHIARKSRPGLEDSNGRTMCFKGLIPPTNHWPQNPGPIRAVSQWMDIQS